jgi:anti-anti-sigma factor
MPLRITQQEWARDLHGRDEPSRDGETLLKVEGSLYLQDAELLERVCREVGEQTGHRIVLDLADLSFLDSDSASVLCRLKREQNVSLEGLHLFIAKVIELTEAEAMVSEYLTQANQTERDSEAHTDAPYSDTIQRVS